MGFATEIKDFKWMKAVPGGPVAVEGVTAGGVHCGLKPGGELDLALFTSSAPCKTAAFYTQNRLLGAHIPVFRKRLKESRGRCSALLVNSKNANCATGERGIRDNEEISAELAGKLGISPDNVLFASTGVIGERLPVAKIRGALDAVVAGAAREKNCAKAARAIMTTDTRPKYCAARVEQGDRSYVIGGVAKGSGMICPDMATMFSFIFTDADVPLPLLRKTARACVERTYNRISVDGDTSPNDTVLVMANGLSGVKIVARAEKRFAAALEAVARHLSMEIVRDGEGATKLVHVEIAGARSDADAEAIAREIAGSQLVKTAIFGMDPNWGRIVSAAGVSGADFDPARVRLDIDGARVYDCGRPVDVRKKIMRKKDVYIKLDAGLGSGSARFWTCDLSYDYVKINAEYTT